MKRYHDWLVERLRKDPKEAAEYLNTVLEEGNKKMFLIAMRNVAEAQGGLSKMAAETKLNRANLYKIFSEEGNPEIDTLFLILKSLGLRLAMRYERS